MSKTIHKLGLLIFPLLAYLMHESLSVDSDNIKEFIGCIGLIVCYGIFEIIFLLIKNKNAPMLIMPVAIATIQCFILEQGISNHIYLGAEIDFLLATLGPDCFYWMNNALFYVFIALYAMWFGYRSQMGNSIANLIQKQSIFRQYIRKKYSINWTVIASLILISIIARLVQISLGIFGYSSDVSELYHWAAYRQYLDIGVSMSRIALVALALANYANRGRDKKLFVCMVGVLVFEVLASLLSGFKGQTILPVIIVGLCNYFYTNKIPFKWIFAAIATLMLAYIIIQPFREIRYNDIYFENRDLGGISSAMKKQADGIGSISGTYNKFMDKYSAEVVSRTSLLPWVALAIQYVDEQGTPDDVPPFLMRTLASPILAFVPRLIWPSKPLIQDGMWFSQKIRGDSDNYKNSIGMGMVGAMYFMGGWLAIVLGFIVVGIGQRAISKGFIGFGSGGVIIFFGVLESFSLLNGPLDAVLTTTFRFIPILVVGQYFIFKE